MKRCIVLLIWVISISQFVQAQQPNVPSYKKKTYMIAMRDGIKLNTVVFIPDHITTPLPILIQRTPYGADKPEGFDLLKVPYIHAMANEGYIFVFQDVRGKFKSEGSFEMNRPLYHVTDKTKTDESTDTYDATGL